MDGRTSAAKVKSFGCDELYKKRFEAIAFGYPRVRVF
jgi:hypothetical protein